MPHTAVLTFKISNLLLIDSNFKDICVSCPYYINRGVAEFSLWQGRPLVSKKVKNNSSY